MSHQPEGDEMAHNICTNKDTGSTFCQHLSVGLSVTPPTLGGYDGLNFIARVQLSRPLWCVSVSRMAPNKDLLSFNPPHLIWDEPP